MTKQNFPAFNLVRLLKTVFTPQPGERVAILIDLADPRMIREFAFLKDPSLTIQRHACEVFYQGLKNGGMAELNLTGGDLFATKSPAAAISICPTRPSTPPERH